MESQIPQTIEFADFLKVEMRVGTIVEAHLNEKAIKPAFTLKIDFGEFGIKNSSAQITENYTIKNLIRSEDSRRDEFCPETHCRNQVGSFGFGGGLHDERHDFATAG